MDSETSCQPSATPKPCANGCGFFGTESTMNLCSKCYKGHLLKAEQSTAARAAVKRSLSSLSASEPEPVIEAELEKADKIAVAEVGKTTTSVGRNRCGCCNKKVGIVGFVCKCGTTFCGSHRYPEEHQCTFDFKVAGRAALAKDNPLVVADKLQRI